MERSENKVSVVQERNKPESNYNGKDVATYRDFIRRIRDLSEYNEKLERVVADQSRELTGVITSNSKVISIIAHDLRNPFISIIGILEMIRDYFEHNQGSDIEKYIDIATESANSSLNLLDNLAAWAVSQDSDRAMHPEVIDLIEMLMDEIRIIRCSAIQKQVSLVYSIPPELSIVADEQMIKTVLRNLINNAVKYSNIGGEVKISASKENDYLEFSVQDTGIGISYEDQRKLFRKDILHSTPGTNKEKGTGLGLLLCKEFTEKHNGKIRLISEPGKGSKFIVTLPNPA
ncbi:MAG: sensor histidine kinase [Balneolaceae bacterium]|nr:MAG: sensor histidine kinase [Balneolaceae bacterium]